MGLSSPTDLFFKATMASGQCHTLAAWVRQYRFVPWLACNLPQGLGFQGSQACSQPPSAHLSIRMASVRRSFSSQVSLSSAMIFSVSWGSETEHGEIPGSVCMYVGWGVQGYRGVRKGAAEPWGSDTQALPSL